MTKEVHALVSSVLKAGMDVDPFTQTAYDVYNNILRMISPLNNQAKLEFEEDDLLKLFLRSYDYRSDSFQNDIESFCGNMSSIVEDFAKSGDAQLIAVASILLYAKNTDIEQKACNKLINDIIEMSPDDSDGASGFSHRLNTTIGLLSSNVVGQQSLDLDTKFQMNELISAVGDLLGTERFGRSSVNSAAVPSYHMRSVHEWGIDVSKFLEMNRRVINGKDILPSEVIDLINQLQIDTSSIDFESFKPTIYDIMNIRFCWSFRWIFQWILMTPSEETGKMVLNTVTGCLLATDKHFIELDYSYLTLVEIVLNCLYALIHGLTDGGYDLNQKRYAYYAYIRAKELAPDTQPQKLRDVSRVQDLEKIHSVYKEVRKLQQKIVSSLKGLGFVEPTDATEKQSLLESLVQLVKSDMPREFTDTSGLSTSDSMVQLFRTLEQLEQVQQTQEILDATKLLSEAAGLSTALSAFSEGLAGALSSIDPRILG